jgi:YD repeat-containing protein
MRLVPDNGCSRGTVQQKYVVINGQAKMTESFSDTVSERLDSNGQVTETSHQIMTVHYSYDADGRLISAYGEGITESVSSGLVWTTDPNGTMRLVADNSRSSGIVRQTYTIINGQAKLLSSYSDTTTERLDLNGQVVESSRQILTVVYDYDMDGRLIGAEGFGTTESGSTAFVWNTEPDGTMRLVADNSRSQGTIHQTYIVVNGQAKLMESFSDTTTDRLDANGHVVESSRQIMAVSYSYDTDGRLVYAEGLGTTQSGSNSMVWTTDPDGTRRLVADNSRSRGTVRQKYIIMNGQAKLLESYSDTTTERLDANGSVIDISRQILTVKYAYDRDGRLVSASGEGTTESVSMGLVWTTDPDGTMHLVADNSRSHGTIRQSYIIINGQAKLLTSNSDTTTDRLDANGQAVESSRQVLAVTYSYDRDGRLIGAVGVGTTESGSTALVWTTDPDGTRRLVPDNSRSRGTIRQSYIILNGQAKLLESYTDTTTDRLDANGQVTESSRQILTVRYTYDGDGRLIGAFGSGTTESGSTALVWTTDPDGTMRLVPDNSRSRGTIRQSYIILNGQAKLQASFSDTTTERLDSSGNIIESSRQIMTVLYLYDADGRLISAEGTGTTETLSTALVWTTDANGTMRLVPDNSRSRGTIRQTYVILNGQAKLLSSYSDTTTERLDSNNQVVDSSRQILTVTYTYDVDGRLTGAEGWGTTESGSTAMVWTTDPNGTMRLVADNSRSRGTIHQTYVVLNGQAKLLESYSDTTTERLDANNQVTESSRQMLTVVYAYDSDGRLVGAEGFGTTESGSNTMVWTTNPDGSMRLVPDNSRSRGTIHQTYIVLNGQAKLLDSESDTTTDRFDANNQVTESSRQILVVHYSYDSDGRLNAAVGSGTTESGSTAMVWTTDPDGTKRLVADNSRSHGTIRQTYIVINGQAKLLTSFSDTTTDRLDSNGRVSESSRQILTVRYTYDSDGRLNGATGSGTTESGSAAFVWTTDPDGTKRLVPDNSRSRGIVRQSYIILNGQAKLLESYSDTTTERLDSNGTVTESSRQILIVRYNYDSDGRLNGATGSGTTESGSSALVWTTEPDGTMRLVPDNSRSRGTIRQTYVIMNGQAKIKESFSDTTTERLDANNTVIESSRQILTVRYVYDSDGRLTEASGSGTTESGSSALVWTTDPDGTMRLVPDNSRSRGIIRQSYIILNGQAKLLESYSDTTSEKLDSNNQVIESSRQILTVRYTYDSDARLVGAEGSGTTETGSTAMVWTTAPNGTMSLVPDTSRSRGIIRQSYIILNGQAKLLESYSDTTTERLDLNGQVIESSRQMMTVRYSYDKDGRLNGAQGSGTTESTTNAMVWTTDPSGTMYLVADNSRSRGTIRQSYIVINGQAKLLESRSDTTTERLDSNGIVVESSRQILTVKYAYDSDGRLIGAEGEGTTESGATALVWTTNSSGSMVLVPDNSRSRGIIRQTYIVINGQAKLLESYSDTTTDRLDSNGRVSESSRQILTVRYSYDSDGRLNAAIGSGTTTTGSTAFVWTTDPDGTRRLVPDNSRSRGTIRQKYIILNGQAKLLEFYMDMMIDCLDFNG